jgi:uncharacterized protein (DUF1499 family)
MNIALMVVLASLAAFGAYVRLAPSDPQKWHQMPDIVAHADMHNGAVRVVEPADIETLKRLTELVRNSEHTKELAGSLDDGMLTYISRSKFWGFPDYMTMRLQNNQLEIYSRLRFGRSDFGVNAARIDGWVRLLSE